MVKPAFSHVTQWVFDLDNTLYPPHMRLFDQIEVLMTDYVVQAIGVDRAEADRLRSHYWRQYGTTLAGLMAEHDLDPDPYLHAVHQVDMSHMDARRGTGRSHPVPARASHCLHQRQRALRRASPGCARPERSFRCDLWGRARGLHA